MLTISVYIFLGFSYNMIYLGRILPAVGKEALAGPLMILFNSIFGLAVWSYLKVYLANPGHTPQQWHNFVEKAGGDLPVCLPRDEWQPGKATFCKKCGCPRPERAHHCSICATCIMRYDHHCPWINNCVGIYNHKYFIQLGLYSALASFIALVTSLPELCRCTLALFNPEDRFHWISGSLQPSDIIVFLTSGALYMIFSVLLSLLVLIHVPLAAKNVTSVEGNYENMPNPFDLGDVGSNFAQIFGVYGPDWLLPVAPVRPLTDGVVFARLDDRLGPEGLPNEASYLIGSAPIDDEVELLWRERYHVRDRLAVEIEEGVVKQPAPATDAATQMASQMNQWLSEGEIPQLSPTTCFPAGESPLQAPNASGGRSQGSRGPFSSISRWWSDSQGARSLAATPQQEVHYVDHTPKGEMSRTLIAL